MQEEKVWGKRGNLRWDQGNFGQVWQIWVGNVGGFGMQGGEFGVRFGAGIWGKTRIWVWRGIWG